MIDLSLLLQFLPVIGTGAEILAGIAITAALLSLGAGIYMILTAPTGLKGKPSLGDFTVTSAREGIPVPMIFGKVKIPGNIIYYGNVYAHERSENVGKGNRVTTGYQYSLNMWQGICEGPGITLHSVYKNDKPTTADDAFGAGNWTFNDGSSSTYPVLGDSPYTTSLNPIAHIYIEPWYLDLNVINVPNIEYLVSREAATGLTNENLANGENPAAVVYEILESAGAIPASQFVWTSFDAAATEWSSRNFGLNISFQEHMECREMLLKVRDFVDFSIYQDKNNQWVLTAWKDGESSVADLSEDDYLSFKFKRSTHHKCYARYTAKFNDETQDFSERVIGIRTTHLREMMVYEKPMDVDLTAFRTVASASRRLMELVRQYSYPFAEIEITTNLSFMDTIFPGSVITITNADYGYAQTKFRVLDKDISEIDKNELGFSLRQIVEGVYEDTGYIAGGSSWVPPDIDSEPAAAQGVYEMPFNMDGSDLPRYVVLAHRASTLHIGYDVYLSVDGSTYNLLTSCGTWSCKAVVAAQYLSTTDCIDESSGILITATTPVPSTFVTSVSRGELFQPKNLCLIGTELMSYQNVASLGGNQYRLTGVIRGLYNTTIATHNVAAVVWLFQLGDNILNDIEYGSFYLKLLPYTSPHTKTVTLADVSAISVTSSFKAQTPWPVSRIKVVKVGAANAVSIWPASKVYTGAGAYDADDQTDAWPPSLDGEILWSSGGSYTAETSCEFTVTQAGSFTLSIIHRRNARSSTVQTLSVGAGDGTYIGPNV